MALLELESLTVEIATPLGMARIVDGIDVALEAGESLGLVGESGCGKSMTALAIMGLLPEAARVLGRLRLDGQDLLALDEPALCALRGRRMAMVFQEPMTALNPVCTIGDQVGEGLRLHFGKGESEAARDAAALLERVGLPPARFPLGLFPHQLSGGQRQRVVIAMALACRPALLIADEPTTALDVTIQAQILDLIVEIARDEGMALLMISHDLGVIAETTDRMLVMYAGRIVERGKTAEVFSRMAHPYTRGLFAALPQGHDVQHAEGDAQAAGRQRLATIPGQVPDPLARPAGCRFAPRCGWASEACRAEPEVVTLDPGHRVACFHPQGGAP